MNFSPLSKTLAADTLQMRMFSIRLSSVEFASLNRFVMTSTILKIQLDLERRVSDVFGANTRKAIAGGRNAMPCANKRYIFN